jgi:hypothetical protein
MNIIIKRVALLSCIFTVITLSQLTAQSSKSPEAFLVDVKLLEANKIKVRNGDKDMIKAVRVLSAEADAALKNGPYTIVTKTKLPPSGDKHDYMSVGPYWWPDSTKADGLPYIRRDGVVNPERHGVKDADDLKLLGRDVKLLGLAYYFTSDEKYVQHARVLLRTWFLDKETKMNPHLKYGQAIPGITEGRGIGIIDTKCMVDIIDGVQLIKNSKSWSEADHKALQSWFSEFLNWMLTSPIGKDEADEHNNHGVYYDLQVVAMSLFLGNKEQAKKILQEQTLPRIESQINEDGSQPHELARTKSWGYVTMNLKGFFGLARLGEHANVDLWNYQTAGGKSIKKAFEWLLPYASGEKPWTHQQIEEPVEWKNFVPTLRMAEGHYNLPGIKPLMRQYEKEYKNNGFSILTNTMFY